MSLRALQSIFSEDLTRGMPSLFCMGALIDILRSMAWACSFCCCSRALLLLRRRVFRLLTEGLVRIPCCVATPNNITGNHSAAAFVKGGKWL
ncbi:hypothetical protein ACHAWO_005885 [Cyclotella atomus]|uniref:Uncharacterized protein n=1 Tax=Cyclotella atomus TaxID=382360 RepID=A0ABD3MVI2_9STRA